MLRHRGKLRDINYKNLCSYNNLLNRGPLLSMNAGCPLGIGHMERRGTSHEGILSLGDSFWRRGQRLGVLKSQAMSEIVMSSFEPTSLVSFTRHGQEFKRVMNHLVWYQILTEIYRLPSHAVLRTHRIDGHASCPYVEVRGVISRRIMWHVDQNFACLGILSPCSTVSVR